MEKQYANLSNSTNSTNSTNNDEIKTKLKHILETSKCNHKVEIMKEPNLKRPHIYIVHIYIL